MNLSVFLFIYSTIKLYFFIFYDERCKMNFPVRDNKVLLYCITLRCVALRCVALRCVALRCVALRCVALRCVALRCVALRCVALRCVALRCVALRCVALRCVALRCVALRCVALRCVALRCIHPSIVRVSQAKNKTVRILQPDVAKAMFKDVEVIYQFHHDTLLPELQKRLTAWCVTLRRLHLVHAPRSSYSVCAL